MPTRHLPAEPDKSDPVMIPVYVEHRGNSDAAVDIKVTRRDKEPIFRPPIDRLSDVQDNPELREPPDMVGPAPISPDEDWFLATWEVQNPRPGYLFRVREVFSEEDEE